jgi:FtsP/CotA-like multicopper oxidase with cupredoxin domain
MAHQRFLNRIFSFLMLTTLIFSSVGSAQAKSSLASSRNNLFAIDKVSEITGTSVAQPVITPVPPNPKKRITPAEKQAAGARNTAAGLLPGLAGDGLSSKTAANHGNLANTPQTSPVDETVIPHYFGPFANYANSPLPTGIIESITVNSPGSGYTSETNVTIVDSYGTGKDATAEAVLGTNGRIDSITIINTGTGYTAPMVVITDVNGTGAVATPNLGSVSGGIRKFVDSLAGLTFDGRNNLQQYIPIAIPDTTSFPGSDYYEIELGQYTEKLHSDLPPTTLRGYRQTNTSDATVSQFHFLGPLIIAKRNTPVRIKFTNKLGTGVDGDLFIPVDESVMGAGMGPKDAMGMDCDPSMGDVCEKYSQNRATLHLHGGLVPWISDGTPHQWITPAGESTQYPKGVSVRYVPDMWYDPVTHQVVPAGTPGATNDPGDGSQTFYYNNQQSARLQFYHDHAYGITRLNVYAGEAAGYLVTDDIDQDLINGTNNSGVNPGLVKALPDIGTPLILQDKTFVDANTIAAQDPTWKWGTGIKDSNGRPAAKTGDLWVPHVYMPVQNPWDAIGGTNAFGRWQYGPWFWPPTEDIAKKAVANEYFDPLCNPLLTWCEPPLRPDSPTPSMGMEAYNDTAMVNGTIYPYMEVQPKPYRFRILNAANDRFFNLQLYVAADKNSPTTPGTSGTQLCNGSVPVEVCTEVKMVNALATDGFPETWPQDGRVGGAPDPATAGPAWIQIGTEGGFLPAPVVIENQPINWNMNPGNFNFSNVTDHSLLLGNAERADVVVDFSDYAGKTIILYNDAPTAFPALDPRYDYFTGDASQMTEGGAPTTQPGFGPNTRTIMQFRVSGTPSTEITTNSYTPAVLDKLNAVFASTATKHGVFETGQDPIIVPQDAYSSAYYGKTFPNDASQYVKITDRSMTFTPMGSTTPVTITFQEKAIHDEMGASYDQEYGRMSGNLGLELPGTNNLNQNIILYGYASPPVDVLKESGISQIGTLGDGTQLWKITHNGVDTHPIHFHLVNVQVINRVGWDGMLLRPDANELGWKETVRVNPLESIIVAMRPKAPTQPFEIPNSVRLIDPMLPPNAVLMGPPGGFLDPLINPITVTNHMVNYGWEYVWHCHILSHEEMDMMHSLAFASTPRAPTNLQITGTTIPVLTWQDNSIAETRFTIQRATDPEFTTDLTSFTVDENVTTFTDTTLPVSAAPESYYYRVTADNVVGDTSLANFPVQVGSSDPTNTSTGNSVGGTSKISGNTAGIGAVTITYTGGSALSSSTGSYLLTVPTIPNGWTGTVTPSKAGYSFSPSKIDFTGISSNQTNQNFTLFSKIAPLSGINGTANNPTISWTVNIDATSYEYCVDEVKNTPDICDTTWVNVGTNTNAVLSGLKNSTSYYWQVRAANGTQPAADGGNWWSFNTIPGSFTKSGPPNGGTPIIGSGTTLSWTTSSDAKGYQYCYDLTNNATCEGPWVYSGTDAISHLPKSSVDLTGLTRGKTYYWQVRAVYAGAATYADDTSTQFWSFKLENPGGITIDQSAPATAQYGSTFTVSATSLYGPVIYTSLTPTVCTNVLADFTMRTSTGICTVKFEVIGSNGGTITESISAQKAQVTISADAKHKVFGEADPILTYTGNLLFNDTLTLKREPGEDTGNYKISVNSFPAGSKYILTFVEANLTIDKLSIVVKPDAKTKVYGSADPVLTYTSSPNLLGTDHFTGSLSRVAGKNIGDYALTLGTLTAGGNYTLAIEPAKLTITPKAISVMANARTKTYGDADPALSYQITNGFLAPGDSLTLKRTSGESVGLYAITVNTFPASGNYVLIFTGSNLLINNRHITVTADEVVKVYHGVEPKLTYKVTKGSLAFSDKFAGALVRTPGEDMGSYPILQGTLTLNNNYILTYIGANLLVAPTATVTIIGNTGIGGVNIGLAGGTPITTASDGSYSLKVPYNWSGTITPTKTGYAFSPKNRTYTNLRMDKPADNYTALVSISGNVGIGGANLSFTDGIAKKITADVNGNYKIWVSNHWSGRLTPSKTGIPSFTPAYRQYSNVITNVVGQNYKFNKLATFVSTAQLDGYSRELSETSGTGGSINANSPTVVVGDDALNRELRTFLSFNTVSIPDNAVIVSVTLKLKKYGSGGGNPFSTQGALRVDLRKPYFGGTFGLQLDDFNAPASMSTAAVIGPTEVNGYYLAKFTNISKSQINKTGLTQLRLRFSLDDDNDKIADYLAFYSGDVPASNLSPSLEIIFYVP